MTTAATETRADLSAADINDLPDDVFGFIEPGGTKDASGKTTPRSKRHFPLQDKAHAQNALDRMDSSPFGAKAKPAILAACKRFGIEVSGQSSAQRDPAWEQRRKRWAGSLIRQAGRRSMKLARGNIEVRAKPDGTGGTRFEFHGYGATFNDPFPMWDPWGDPYDEEVEPGSFSESLGMADLDTPFLIGHNDAGIPLARTWQTLKMGQDTHGLETLANMNGRRSDVQNLALAVEDGNIDEMSIGFVTKGQRWSDDWSKRYMTNLDIHRGDVSVVALAANQATKGASMVALPTETLSRQAAEQRAQDEIADLSKQPDFNLATDDPAANGAAAVKCPYTRKNGCGQMLPGASKFCPNCGGPVYDGSGTLVVDDSGVVEASEGDSDLLSRRLRLLELA